MKQLITLMLLISTFILNAQSTEKRICVNILTEINTNYADTIYSEDKNCNLYLLTEEDGTVELLLIEHGKVTLDERYRWLCNVQNAILYRMGSEYMFLYEDKIVIQSRNKITTYNCKTEDRTPEPEYEFLLDSVTITDRLTPITFLSDTMLTTPVTFENAFKITTSDSISFGSRYSYNKVICDTVQAMAHIMTWGKTTSEIKSLYAVTCKNTSLFYIPDVKFYNLDFTPFIQDPKKHYFISYLNAHYNEK